MHQPVRTWTENGAEHFLGQRVRHARMHRPLTERLLGAAGITDTDRVLDVGCGCGDTTRDAARRARHGFVLGIDVSPELLEQAAVDTAEAGLGNVEFRHADAQTHPLVGYDVAVSSFGMMFFANPRAAFVNICSALRPGGRLTFLCWQAPELNEFFTLPFGAITAVTGLPERVPAGRPAAFSLADPEHIQSLLGGAGFLDVDITGVTEPLHVGDDPVDVADYFCDTPGARALLDGVDHVVGSAVRASLVTALQARQQARSGISLGSATWLVSAHR